MTSFNVFISDSYRPSLKRALKKIPGSFSWAYLGLDSNEAFWLEGGPLCHGKRVRIAKTLQETAKRLRNDYISLIGSLSLEYHSLPWWQSSLSEKNPHVSQIFLEICYADLCLKWICSWDDTVPLLLIVESKALRKLLRTHFLNQDLLFWESHLLSYLRLFKKCLEWVARRGLFLLVHAKNNLLAKLSSLPLLREQNSASKMAWVVTWVDERSFDHKGRYQSINFGNLGDYLREKGERVIILPKLLYTVSFRQALKFFHRSREPFLMPEAYLTFMDVLRSIWRAEKNRIRILKKIKFANFDVTPLIQADLNRDYLLNRPATEWLFDFALKRMKEKGLKMTSFIYPYENHAWEKAAILAIKKYFPWAKTVGYQHGTLSLMLLNYFFSTKEAHLVPQPDRLITNGDLFYRLFIEEGYSSSQLVNGGAIRYPYLFKEKAPDLGLQRKFVLVTPSLGETLGTELILKITQALKNLPQYPVIIRCHPSLPFETIAKMTNLPLFPDHFSFQSKEPFAEIVQKAGVLIYQDSTTALEALAAGIPLIQVSSDHMVDLDPLDHCPESRISVSEPEEIERHVKKIMQETQWKEDNRKKQGLKILHRMFNEPSSAYPLFRFV